ncbi:MAG: GGDEF domain-containing protein [Clostridia bacterium]|nr:GGDEF domain-containing protein [Clostridia bacterium]
MKNSRRPLNRSITIGCVLFIIFLCVLLSMVNLSIYKNYVYDDYREYIWNILDYSLAHIDGDDLKTCIETCEESEQYKQTLLFMDSLMDHFNDIHYFYAILPLNTEPTGNVMSVLSAERYYDRYIDTEGNLYLGWVSDDEFDAETAAQMFDVMKSDTVVYFEEKTEWGTDYTGALPIRDSAGNSVAVLAVDIDISFINGMILRYAAVNICIISLSGVIFTGLFIYWSRRNITKPIKQLEKSAVGFADHSHGQRSVEALSFDAPEIQANNEIKTLSDAVVKMSEDMRDYVSDIISAEKKAANMQELANRDALTSIRNKTAYDNEIKRIEVKIEDGETAFGLAVVDLNYLKKINDTYGHDKGNIAIRKLCQTVCSIFDHSPIFRIGGDEFAIILRGHDYEHYDELLARFNGEIEKMAADDTLQPWEKISAAIGAAFYDPAVDENTDSLFRRADHVMYDRKKEMKAGRTDC